MTPVTAPAPPHRQALGSISTTEPETYGSEPHVLRIIASGR